MGPGPGGPTVDDSSGTEPVPGEAPVRISGGMATFDDPATIQEAVASLLHQELPEGVRWGHLWVVASAPSPHFLRILQDLSEQDPRVRVIIEPERQGKASAINTIFRQAKGDYLVLLNADDRAEPGSVRALLSRARGFEGPVAVMGHPLPSAGTSPPLRDILGLLWELHHTFHQELFREGSAAHLSDNLLLLSPACLLPFPEGVINDGAYLGVRLRGAGGELRYAPGARVTMSVPLTLADHLAQRRRIHVGHRQVTRRLGRAPTTFQRATLTNPKLALRALRQALRETPHPLRALLGLCVLEGLSRILALWDSLPPERDHVRWSRIRAATLSVAHRGQ